MKKSATPLVFVFLAAVAPGYRLRGETSDLRSPNGFWTSQGYGLLFEVREEKIVAYQITAHSCLRDWEAKTRRNEAGELIYMRSGCERRFIADAGSKTARLKCDCSVTDIVFHRLDSPPRTFGVAVTNTPENNFRIFSDTFAENYPFFELRQVDWGAIDGRFRSQAAAATSPEELFRIFTQMLEPLHDLHTAVMAPALKRTFRGSRTNHQRLDAEEYSRASKVYWTHYVRGGLRPYCNQKIWFGMLDNDMGFMVIPQFTDFATNSDFQVQLQSADQGLDEIFAAAQKLKGLVIDVRYNSGGYDELALRLASRLTGQEYAAFTVQARENDKSSLRFEPAQSVRITPRRPGFSGKVALLMGPDTSSAAEVCALALAGRKPAVIRIGEPSQGVFSDTLSRKLPNGWQFTLPNQLYAGNDGRSFEHRGIPPDISVPVFAAPDVDAGRDLGIEKALQLLKD